MWRLVFAATTMACPVDRVMHGNETGAGSTAMAFVTPFVLEHGKKRTNYFGLNNQRYALVNTLLTAVALNVSFFVPPAVMFLHYDSRRRIRSFPVPKSCLHFDTPRLNFFVRIVTSCVLEVVIILVEAKKFYDFLKGIF